jgi:hypothetical protein
MNYQAPVSPVLRKEEKKNRKTLEVKELTNA